MTRASVQIDGGSCCLYCVPGLLVRRRRGGLPGGDAQGGEHERDVKGLAEQQRIRAGPQDCQRKGQQNAGGKHCAAVHPQLAARVRPAQHGQQSAGKGGPEQDHHHFDRVGRAVSIGVGGLVGGGKPRQSTLHERQKADAGRKAQRGEKVRERYFLHRRSPISFSKTFASTDKLHLEDVPCAKSTELLAPKTEDTPSSGTYTE